ncbi:MAG: YkvA family protein [Saprospiraceae bacterium]
MTDEEKYKNIIENTDNKELDQSSLWKKITKYAKKAGLKAVYSVLLLYYAYKRKDTPSWAKRIITGTIAYFIMPIDAIPDLTPFLGFTDDLGILGIGLVMVAAYINEDVRANARGNLTKWFGEVNEEELKEIDDKL